MNIKDTCFTIATLVRSYAEETYGSKTNLKKQSITLCNKIIDILNQFDIQASLVKGWCVYEVETSKRSKCYAKHTWVEIEKSKLYIDITADQFQSKMLHTHLNGIIVGKKPNCMVYDEPSFNNLSEIPEIDRLPYKPKVPNKYNLKPKDIQRAIVLDENRLHQKPFWRNNGVQAWCLSGGTGKGYYGDWIDEYWIGFYDKDAKAYAGKIRLNCSAGEGMLSYNFKEFYRYKEIENSTDLALQEKLLETINWLIDEHIIEIPKKEGNPNG